MSFNPQTHSGAGFGQLNHDHHGGREHADGNLSHHRDRQWRRRAAKHHRDPDGDGSPVAGLAARFRLPQHRELRNRSCRVTSVCCPRRPIRRRNNGVTFGWVRHASGARPRPQCHAGSAAGRINFAHQWYRRRRSMWICRRRAPTTCHWPWAMPATRHAGCSARSSFWMATRCWPPLTKGLPTRTILRCEGKQLVGRGLAQSNLSQQVTLTGTRLTVVVGTNQTTGDATPIAFLGVAQAGGGSPNYRALGLAGFADHSARQSGHLDDHLDDQRRLQRRDQSVGFGRAVGDDGQLQSADRFRRRARATRR